MMKNIIIRFFYPEQLTTQARISNITLEQWKQLFSDSIRLAEINVSNGNLHFVESLSRIISIWHSISQSDLLLEWTKFQYEPTEIITSNYRNKIDALIDSGRGTWQPIEPDIVKCCYDIAANYIRDYSDCIIKAHNLIRGRARIGDADLGNISLVRQDGKTKEIFKQLKELNIPTIDDDGTPLFEIKETTKLVRSKGYTSGWQERTWLIIEEIRPQVINLKRACIYIIGLFTGLRRREIAELPARLPKFSENIWWLDIVRFKTEDDPNETGTPDCIPIPGITAKAIEVLYYLLENNRQALESNFLILADILTKKQFEKAKINTIGLDVRRFTSEFSGQSCHTHQLRKTIAWLLISRSEQNINLIRQLFGHKSFKMTFMYILRNILLVSSVIELLEHNYTEDLIDALEKIVSGEAVGDLAEAIRQRSDNRYFKGQILNTSIETYIHEVLQAGLNIFISRIPIGGFCIALDDWGKDLPPCMQKNGATKPQPQFCDYKICSKVLHTNESIENVKKQIDYYKRKLSYLDESVDDSLLRQYQKEVDDNLALLIKLETQSKQHSKEIIA